MTVHISRRLISHLIDFDRWFLIRRHTIEVGLTPSGGGAALPPPPGRADEDCREKRHRIFVDAQDIQSRDDRMKMLRTAPVCK